MTVQNDPRKTPSTDDVLDNGWVIGLFSISGLAVTVFVFFLASTPSAGKPSPEIAQAEFPIPRLQAGPDAQALVPPVKTARLDSGR